jgi:hypothetical protein
VLVSGLDLLGLSGAVLGEVGPVMMTGGGFSLDDTEADLRENEPDVDQIRADLTAVTGIAALTDFADTVPYHLLFTLPRGVTRAHRGDQYGDDHGGRGGSRRAAAGRGCGSVASGPR